MQYIVWAVHDGGLLSLLALYTRLEWIYLYVLCFLFSVMLFDCFVFFWLILLISIFALFCCLWQHFRGWTSPFRTVFNSFCPFCWSFWIAVVLASCCVSCLVFLHSFRVFSCYFYVVSHFLDFVHSCDTLLICLFCMFLAVSFSYAPWYINRYMGGTWSPLPFPKNFCDGRVVTSDNIAGHICSPYTCHKYVLLDHLCFFLSCYSFRMYLGIPRHPSEPIVTDLSPSFPLMDVHTYMSLGENFPDQTWIESMLCRPMSVSFCLVCLYVHSTIPHHTHTNPSAPI